MFNVFISKQIEFVNSYSVNINFNKKQFMYALKRDWTGQKVEWDQSIDKKHAFNSNLQQQQQASGGCQLSTASVHSVYFILTSSSKKSFFVLICSNLPSFLKAKSIILIINKWITH